MNRPRSARLILALLSLPLSTFAAPGEAKVVAVRGAASVSSGSTAKAPLTTGGVVTQESVVETDSGSSVYLRLPNGGKLVVGPNSRVRLSSFSTGASGGSYSLELILTRGSITGDATNAGPSSSLKVRTTSGVVRLAGTLFQIGFAPAGAAGGTLTVTAINGIASVSPAGALTPVSVPPGNTLSLTSNGSLAGNPQLTATTSATAGKVESILGSPGSGATEADAPITTTSKPVENKNGGAPRFDPTANISPNGEGLIN